MLTKEKRKVTPDELRELLEKSGWSEARLADELRCSAFAIRKWLLGENAPRSLHEYFLKVWLHQVRAGHSPTTVEELTNPLMNSTNGQAKRKAV